jgi:hypothetical protein
LLGEVAAYAVETTRTTGRGHPTPSGR